MNNYISTLALLDELICTLGCKCLKKLKVYEELGDDKVERQVPNITTIDNVVNLSSNRLNIVININLPAKNWKQIADIVTCITCVRNLETEHYIVHNAQFQGTSLIATELKNNVFKSYQGTLLLSVSKKIN